MDFRLYCPKVQALLAGLAPRVALFIPLVYSKVLNKSIEILMSLEETKGVVSERRPLTRVCVLVSDYAVPCRAVVFFTLQIQPSHFWCPNDASHFEIDDPISSIGAAAYLPSNLRLPRADVDVVVESSTPAWRGASVKPPTVSFSGGEPGRMKQNESDATAQLVLSVPHRSPPGCSTHSPLASTLSSTRRPWQNAPVVEDLLMVSDDEYEVDNEDINPQTTPSGA
ncbi:hypothetical protein BDK51DRAFT_38071 [Blyttiomyces helicus]|uniref:Uncharacterized protein n=1 Tax=Blyttiomyces helicus TaxID=388810 RepID=A0A4P9W2Q0_9FUNG|nr:hypothetical protein BDK51DRAFT_38071 [Blyttiomyces helicus]|eukprot:RKO85078.1 hypothetical protein BDK51DRAFT_38071 [Blyttiomyces helicus]